MAFKRYSKKGGAKKAVKRRAGVKKVYRRRVAKSHTAQIARVIETGELQCVSSQSYSQYNLNLSQFTRAVSVAKGYQYFRIKKCEFILTPMYDTFDANGATRVPHLYFMVDRVKQLQYFNSYKQLEKLGAKPHRVDDKTIRFSFTPSVLNAVVDLQAVNPTQFDQYKISPWLNCRDMSTIGAWNPSGVDHSGIVWYVSDGGANVIPYMLERRVTFEFKKPCVDLTAGEDINTPAIDWS